jgi:hypothetical protein
MIEIYDSVYLESVFFANPLKNDVEITPTPSESPTPTLTPTITPTPEETLPPPIPRPNRAYTNWLGGDIFSYSGVNEYFMPSYNYGCCHIIYSDQNLWYMESVSSGPGFFPAFTGSGIEYISNFGGGYDKSLPFQPWEVSSWIKPPSTSIQTAQNQPLSTNSNDPIFVNLLPNPIPNQLSKTFRVDIGSIDKETNVPVSSPDSCNELESISCSSAQEFLNAPAYNCKGFIVLNDGVDEAANFSMGADIVAPTGEPDIFSPSPTLSTLLLPVVVNGKLLQVSEVEETYGYFYANEEEINGTNPFWIKENNSDQKKFLLAVRQASVV